MSTATTSATATVRPAGDRAPRPATGRAGAGGALRLTRRGRLVVFAGCLAAVCAGLVLLAGAATGAGESAPSAPTQEVTVHSGDTLWDIATEVDPDADPREVVEEIRRLNDMSGALQAGEKIAVPAPQ